MPSSFPSRRIRTPVDRAPWAAEALDRSIGTWPTPDMNDFCNQPLMPLPVKYSILAGNVTLRDSFSGRKKESETARWLLARMAPPSFGMFSAPSMIRGRKNTFSTGPRKMCFINQYSTAGSASLTDLDPTSAYVADGTRHNEHALREGAGPHPP